MTNFLDPSGKFHLTLLIHFLLESVTICYKDLYIFTSRCGLRGWVSQGILMKSCPYDEQILTHAPVVAKQAVEAEAMEILTLLIIIFIEN